MKMQLLAILICSALSSLALAEKTVTAEELIDAETIKIDPQIGGRPFLAVTGSENISGTWKTKQVERAIALCQKFHYKKPVAVELDWNLNSFYVLDLDSHGNIFQTYAEKSWRSCNDYEGCHRMNYPYATFKVVRCAK